MDLSEAQEAVGRLLKTLAGWHQPYETHMLPTLQTVDVKIVKERNLTAQPWSGGGLGGALNGVTREVARLPAICTGKELLFWLRSIQKTRVRGDHTCPLPPQGGRDQGQPTEEGSKVAAL